MLPTPAAGLSTFSTASPQAEEVTGLFIFSLAILAVILLIVFGLVFAAILRFRGKEGDPEPRALHGNVRLEVTWTVIPFILVAILFTANMMAMPQANAPIQEGQQPDVEVIGHQWWWEVRYPNGGPVTANEVHVPVGRKTLVAVRSVDVIHSFWVPDLGPKIDVMPQQTNHLWLEPRQAGTYWGACAEFCGNAHAWMRFLVVAQEPAEFEAWKAGQEATPPPPADPLAVQGAKIFEDMACLNCHAFQGEPTDPNFGPDLTFLSRRQSLGAGVIANSPENLAKWLKNPQAIKPMCNMPNFNLTDEQVQALVAFLWRTRE